MTPPPKQSQAAPKPRRGCLFYGCLGTMILIVMILLAGYAGYRYAVARFTDSKPMPLPRTQFSVEQIQRLQGRIMGFSRAIEDHRPVGPLVLTTDEANAWIQTDRDWAFLKDQIYVAFTGTQLEARVSVPAESIGSRRLRGRYINAEGSFAVSLTNGQLRVNVQSLSAKGRPLPEFVMQHLRNRNLALAFTNATSDAALSRLQDVRIEDGKLVIVPKPVFK